MRPLFHAKADRLRAKADQLDKEGVRSSPRYANGTAGIRAVRQGIAHLSWGSAARTTRTPRRA